LIEGKDNVHSASTEGVGTAFAADRGGETRRPNAIRTQGSLMTGGVPFRRQEKKLSVWVTIRAGERLGSRTVRDIVRGALGGGED